MTAHTPDDGGLTEAEREALDLAFIDAKVGSTKALFYAAERIKADAYAAGLAARTAPDTEAVEWFIADFERDASRLQSPNGALAGWSITADQWRALRARLRTLPARAAGVREGREGTGESP